MWRQRKSWCPVKRAYLEWGSFFHGEIAFTGTFKQACVYNGSFRGFNFDAAEKNVARFIERCSRDILGRAQVRQGQKLRYFGAIEGELLSAARGEKRFHVHLEIKGMPHEVEFSKIACCLKQRWSKSDWGFDQSAVERIYDDSNQRNWARYCLKDLDPDDSGRFLTNFPYPKR